MNAKSSENRLHRTLAKHGYRLKRSRLRERITIDNLGDYMILDMSTNGIVAGWRFSMTLDQAIAYAKDLV